VPKTDRQTDFYSEKYSEESQCGESHAGFHFCLSFVYTCQKLEILAGLILD